MTNPTVINCVMCYYLCVQRWLIKPILALNCLLQIEQERSEEESSVGDALALAFCCACFSSASLILFALYSPAPLLMRTECMNREQRHRYHFAHALDDLYLYICACSKAHLCLTHPRYKAVMTVLYLILNTSMQSDQGPVFQN